MTDISMPPDERRPRLSILIPTYNRREYVRQGIESALDAPEDTEIVVVDNASPDGTQEMVETLARQDARIRYIRHAENMGALYNANFALKAGRGCYLCLTGDDDFFLPGNFTKKLAVLDAHPQIGFVYSPYFMVDEHNNRQMCPYGSGMLPHSYIGGRYEFHDLIQNNHIWMQTVVFRRELFEHYGAFEDAYFGAADWDMWLRYSYRAQSAYIAEPTVCVRYHTASNTTNNCKDGTAAKARIAVWQKWLVETDPPPVLNESTWQRLFQLFHQDLLWWTQNDHAMAEQYLNLLLQIKEQNKRKVTMRVHLTVREAEFGSSRVSTEAPAKEAIASAAAVASDRSGLLPLLWSAPLFDSSGYAEEARHFLLALEAAGVSVQAHVIPTARHAELSPDIAGRLTEIAGRIPPKGCVHVWHGTAPEFLRYNDAVYNAGRTMFETDRLPEGWAAHCNRMDAVWVPSEFNRETFARAGVEERKLVVVPGTIDPAAYDPNVSPLTIEGARGYNFLSVFDWTLRKGWDILLRAYIEEFSPEEDVALIIKTSSYPERGYTLDRIGAEAGRFITEVLGRDLERIPDIVLQDTALPAHDMPSLYRAADCFVLPSHGEGWGRPYMEAMAMGLPVIGTNWSGNTAFMNRENSFLIDCEVVPAPESACAETPHFVGHCWAEPDGAHLRALMRRAFTERAAAKTVGNRARDHILTNFAYPRVAEIISRLLEGDQMRAAA